MSTTPAQQWRCPRCTKLKIGLKDVACAPGFLGGSAEWLNASTSASSFDPPSKDPFVLEIDEDHPFTRAMIREAVQLGIRRAVRALSAQKCSYNQMWRQVKAVVRQGRNIWTRAADFPSDQTEGTQKE